MTVTQSWEGNRKQMSDLTNKNYCACLVSPYPGKSSPSDNKVEDEGFDIFLVKFELFNSPFFTFIGLQTMRKSQYLQVNTDMRIRHT